MKTAKKLVNSEMLAGVKDAEATLARREVEELESGLPEGHPLRDEAEKQKALLGDLSGLPPGHPLLKAMQAAKDRYDQREKEQGAAREVRQAKKVDADSAKKEARRVEEAQVERHRTASHTVNAGIDAALREVRGLYKTMSEHEEILNMNPYSRAKVIRLKRLLFAAERGLSEGKITRM